MEKKKVPNPNGKKGGDAHRNKIQHVENDIAKRKLEPVREKYEKKAGEMKKSRYIDIIAENKEGDLLEIHQIGRQNKNGEPVKRERKAIEDIEKATGLKVIFHPYNLIILVVFIFVAVTIYLT